MPESRSILIIEDDPDVFSALESIVSTFFPGSRLLNIKSGEEFARGDWKKEAWNLIILDLMLPGVTGFDMCQTIRQNEATRDVPIVSITGYDTPDNKERILRCGATAYLPKPFEVADVVKLLKKYLGRPT